jgi:hypothetical protein
MLITEQTNNLISNLNEARGYKKKNHIPCAICRHPKRKTEGINLTDNPDTLMYLCFMCRNTVYQYVQQLIIVASRSASNWDQF